MHKSREAVAVLFALVVSGCRETQAAPAGTPPAMPVRLSEVHAAPVENATEYMARMDSRRSVELRPQVDGVVTRVAVKSGDIVQAGDSVLDIDPRQQRASVTGAEEQRHSAEATLAVAQQQYQRTLALFRDEAISAQDLDQARANYETARANVAALKSRVASEQVQLRYYSVSAPFDGVIGDVPARVGDLVTPSTTLTTIDQIKNLDVYVYVPGENTSLLKLDLPVQIVDASGVVDSGKIGFISPRIERDTQAVLVKASIPNEKGALRQAQSVRARVVYSTEDRLVVPVTAVSRLGSQSFVFVAEPSGSDLVAHRRSIETGSISGNDYVVEKGLEAKQKVVVSGVQRLSDGAHIRPEG